MSGHSKWATIHRAKEANDAKKGAAFTKLAQAITLAVRRGGGIGDPDKNFHLRLAIDRARDLNMPKDNISRAIERGTGGSGGEQLDEVLFEGFAPGGVAVLVSAVTDNKLRTAQKVREVLDKSGGSMGGSGSVSYLFSQKGELFVNKKPDSSLEEQELEIIDLGVDDLETSPEGFVVYCDRDKTFEVRQGLEKLGYKVESAEITMKPAMPVEVDDTESALRVESILERLEGLDDVQKVWSNYSHA
jgi:YebC/PmpR family DNA-binding regulatory protein